MKEIKFIKYDGKYPNLCSGILTISINDEIIKFGGFDYNITNKTYPSFWVSGGCVGFNSNGDEEVEQKKWILRKESLAPELEEIGQQLIDLFNENVPYGCCGGCL